MSLSLFDISADFRKIYDDDKNAPIAEQMFIEGKSLDEINCFCKKILNRKIADKLRLDIQIPKRYQKATISNYRPITPILAEAKRKTEMYINRLDEMLNEGVNLIYEGYGCVGTGKTHLGYAVINYALDNGYPAYAVNIVDLVDRLKFTNRITDFDKEKMKTIQLLLIDDMDKCQGYDWILFELYGILNSRYDNQLSTVITVENSLSDLNKFFVVENKNGEKIQRGQSINSRLCNDAVIVRVEGADFRLM